MMVFMTDPNPPESNIMRKKRLAICLRESDTRRMSLTNQNWISLMMSSMVSSARGNSSLRRARIRLKKYQVASTTRWTSLLAILRAS